MRFDWYQATVLDHPDSVLSWAASAYPHCTPLQGKGFNGYDARTDFLNSLGGRELSVSYGGVNKFPNALSSGAFAPRFAEEVRTKYPAMGRLRLTRVDSCFDFDEEGAWDKLHPIMQGVALKSGVLTELSGDYDRAVKGRTYYLGGRTSPFRAVLYEKGIQLQDQIVASGEQPKPNWVRLESRYKPPTLIAKEAAVRLEPDQVWGTCRWAPNLVSSVLNLAIARVSYGEFKAPDMENSLYHMAKQYRKTLVKLMSSVDGDFADFGQAIWKALSKSQRYN